MLLILLSSLKKYCLWCCYLCLTFSENLSSSRRACDLSLRLSVESQQGLILCKLFADMFNEALYEADAFELLLIDSVFSLSDCISWCFTSSIWVETDRSNISKLCQWSFFQSSEIFSLSVSTERRDLRALRSFTDYSQEVWSTERRGFRKGYQLWFTAVYLDSSDETSLEHQLICQIHLCQCSIIYCLSQNCVT